MTNAIANIQQRQTLVAKFASRFHIEADKLLPILKATAFKVKDNEVSNEQMAALLVVADQYGLNPFTKELYAFPDSRNGIVPVVSVDGWARIINSHPQFDGMDFQQDEQYLDGGRVVQVGRVGAGDDLQLLCLLLAEMVGLLEPSVLALGLVGEAAGQAPLDPVGRVLWCVFHRHAFLDGCFM